MKTALRQRHVWPREQGAVQQAGPHHLKSGRCKRSCASHSLRPAFLHAKLLGPKQPDPLRPQHATLQLQGCRVLAGHQSTWLLVIWSLEQRNSWLAHGTGAAWVTLSWGMCKMPFWPSHHADCLRCHEA